MLRIDFNAPAVSNTTNVWRVAEFTLNAFTAVLVVVKMASNAVSDVKIVVVHYRARIGAWPFCEVCTLGICRDQVTCATY